MYQIGLVKYYTDKYWALSVGDLGTLSSLATFFIVFYAGNCFSRYNAMYGAVIAIQVVISKFPEGMHILFYQHTVPGHN